jgi:peptide/nickel transport system permease protein
MTRYLAGRLFAGLVALLLFVSILFFMAEWLMPQRADPGELPVWDQYVDYLGKLVGGEFLHSSAVGALPWTLLIFTFAIGIAFPIGHWLGKIAGWRSGEAGSVALTIGSVLAYTVFPPLLVFVIIMLVSRFTNDQGIGFLRTLFNEGALNGDIAWSMLRTVATVLVVVAMLAVIAVRLRWAIPIWVWGVVVAVAPFLVWIVRGMWSEVVDILLYLGIPIVAVTVLALGEVILTTKSTTAEAAHEDFVFAARAKGVPDREVRDHHVGRFALLPILNKLMVSIPFILVGLMIVEISFTWPKFGASVDPSAAGGLGTFGMEMPGMSSTIFTALESRDTATVVDGLIFVGLVVLGCRLVLDVLHVFLDPRVRVGSRAS